LSGIIFKGRVGKKDTADGHTGLFLLSWTAFVVVLSFNTDRVLLMVNRWSTSPEGA